MDEGTYVVLLLVYLVRDRILGSSETGGGTRVGVAFCNLWVVVLVVGGRKYWDGRC